ncbi:hypothetical protein K0M31_010429 [Melipona bicolor]|uniref:Uncharacterized protein n=1 Tax=Melipona bicolor TaxID=60889 RepID=A0AA40KII2_9HYME|nr:hypothetical protein K0M31_010429 [Melipona bicolor]
MARGHVSPVGERPKAWSRRAQDSDRLMDKIGTSARGRSRVSGSIKGMRLAGEPRAPHSYRESSPDQKQTLESSAFWSHPRASVREIEQGRIGKAKDAKNYENIDCEGG